MITKNSMKSKITKQIIKNMKISIISPRTINKSFKLTIKLKKKEKKNILLKDIITFHTHKMRI